MLALKDAAIREGKLRRFLLCKFRQFGGTTVEVGTSDYISGTARGKYCLTMAHDLDSTIKIFDIANRMYDSATRTEFCNAEGPRFHWQRASANRRELKYDESQSVHFIGTAGNLSFGHGLTIQRAHLSEAARFPDLKQTLAALEGVPADGEIVLESTPAGATGLFFELCQEAYYEPKRSEYTMIFFVWYEFDYELPVGLDEAAQILYEVGVGSDPRFGSEERALAETLNSKKKRPLTAGQWKWRRWKRASLGLRFYEQYPEDFVSCWLASGRPFFDNFKLAAIPSGTVIAKHEGESLWIYEDAIAGRDYVLWADPAEGIVKGDAQDEAGGGSDYTAWGIIDRETNEDVAVFIGRITPTELGRQIDKWGHIYNDANAVVERNNHGHAVLLYLIEIARYPNIYHHVDRLNDDGTEDRRPGWPTTVATRTPMLDNLDEEIRAGSYIPLDPRMRAQMIKFVVNEKGRAAAGPGYHDDLVTGRAIGGEVVRQPRNYSISMVA